MKNRKFFSDHFLEECVAYLHWIDERRQTSLFHTHPDSSHQPPTADEIKIHNALLLILWQRKLVSDDAYVMLLIVT